jgi:hypothetical protein
MHDEGTKKSIIIENMKKNGLLKAVSKSQVDQYIALLNKVENTPIIIGVKELKQLFSTYKLLPSEYETCPIDRAFVYNYHLSEGKYTAFLTTKRLMQNFNETRNLTVFCTQS